MSLVPYEPMRQLEQWRHDMNRFFSEAFSTPFTQGLVRPRVDVYETDHEVVASCEVPGLEKKDDIRINVDENMLTISGRINRTSDIKEDQVHRRERFTGTFQRSVSLPVRVSSDGTRATYKNGILEVRMPKVETGTGRRIEVDFNH